MIECAPASSSSLAQSSFPQCAHWSSQGESNTRYFLIIIYFTYTKYYISHDSNTPWAGGSQVGSILFTSSNLQDSLWSSGILRNSPTVKQRPSPLQLYLPIPTLCCQKIREFEVPFATTSLSDVRCWLLISQNNDTARNWITSSTIGSFLQEHPNQ